ncbi:hypothetical protein PAAG_02676 [Paracoccidioides lutzii Pb01]|uniref:Uncharacterized protein n=1 Tax=Paracoccidioides lutzii (strain ATCC MYA-826 / Pb01) TaxID=502779 RepID=C1GVY1_PARBA|nr:hypothetical protein PAAG_02676 [Paracoccidioides lutzii Pb01]EEH40700.1 hypothetical protein PAAG_02676 [Paracoccidioides lutzii Pb01]
MFVNLGLTADAAAAHTHEFSRQSKSQPNSSFLSRSTAAFLPLAFMSSAKQSPNPEALKPLETPPPSQVSPFATPRLSSDEEYTPVESRDKSPDNRTKVVPTAIVKKQQVRTKSSFSFAHSPPSTRRKRLVIRPRLLLQLQQVSQTTRPIPAVDVFTSTICSVSRKFPGIPRTKDGLSTNDLILVTSDAYKHLGAEDDKSVTSDDPQDRREVIATICHHRREGSKLKGMVELCLQQGSRWKASRLPSGGYDFTWTTDSGEQKRVRWALRAKGSRRTSGSSIGPDNTFDKGKRFTFSIIDPTTRRHPVIAWMSRQGIDVLDQYPLSSAPTQEPSSLTSESRVTAFNNSPRPSDYTDPPLIETDDHLRTLIIVSGVWIAFQEGWPQAPIYAEPNPTSPTTATAMAPLSSSSPPHSQPPPQSTQFTGIDPEKVDEIDERSRRKSLSFSGGRIRLGGGSLIHRSKTVDGRSKKSGFPRRVASQGKSRLDTHHEDGPSKSAATSLTMEPAKPHVPDGDMFSHPEQSTVDEHTRRWSDSRGDDQHHPGIPNNTSSPRYSCGEHNQKDKGQDPKSNPSSICFRLSKPEQAKGKRWRRLSRWLDFGSRKGRVS